MVGSHFSRSRDIKRNGPGVLERMRRRADLAPRVAALPPHWTGWPHAAR